MSTRLFTNAGENTLLKKFAGVFESNADIERFDALVGYPEATRRLPSGYREGLVQGGRNRGLEGRVEVAIPRTNLKRLASLPVGFLGAFCRRFASCSIAAHPLPAYSIQQ